MNVGPSPVCALAISFTVALSACGGADPSPAADEAGAISPGTDDPSAAATDAGTTGRSAGSESEQEVDPTTSAPEPVTVEGSVISAVDGQALARATVTAGGQPTVTDGDGRFVLTAVEAEEPVTARRPAWRAATVAQPTDGEPVVLELEPIVVRGLRVSRYAAADPERFDRLLELADETAVNALVFDTKDETDTVLYETGVSYAHEIGAVEPVYDPAALLARARAHDLYAITRIVTFEDTTWARADAEAKLAGAWVDAADRQNWSYPLDLAVEACRLGFDEVQFDYVRFPAGRTAISARALIPPTSEERAATIGEFLSEARSLLHAEGCGVSAAVFGIVMSSETDEGIGQTPEAVSASVDAISPMLYPSHYDRGWLGFSDPNDHPGPVIAHALDLGGPRMSPDTLLRPWLQGFYYGADNIKAQIDEAEARGAGWIIWNASGEYRRDWLPSP